MSLLKYFNKQSSSNQQSSSASTDNADNVINDTTRSTQSLSSTLSSTQTNEADISSSDIEDELDCSLPKRLAIVENSQNTDSIDVANVFGQQLSSNSKYHLIKHHFKPSPNYSFPKSADGRSFQHTWLNKFSWLAYSKQENGGFCLPCVLFSSSTVYHGSEPGILVSKPLINFKKALEILRKHIEKDHHRASVVKSDDFMKVMSNQQPAITSILNRAVADQVAVNRQKLMSIFKTIVFCGRQNISLRGHRDNITDLEKDITGLHNHGNFLALLQFRIDSGDTLLKDHLAKAARNATYTSSVIQNQIIDVVSNQIRDKIIRKVQVAKWFSVIADEVTDVSNEEIMSLNVRYWDSESCIIREDLLGFFECDSGIRGRDLAEKITTTLTSFGLDLSYLRGQAYDGAGNMAGSVNGTAAIISHDYPLALYLHCASHCLNLAVVKSLELACIRNMMNIIFRIYQFFDSHPKRQQALEQAISTTQPESSVCKLKDLCRTRWIQRLDALSTFLSLYESTLSCLDTIYREGPQLWTADSVTDAHGLQLAISTSDFLSALVITNSCLQYLHPLTVSLQGKTIDIIHAVKEIDVLVTTIQNIRDNIERYHSKWYSSIEKLCTIAGTVPSIPRICRRQTQRSNVPADSPSQYYLRTISIPIVDHLLAEMTTRFSSHHKTALLGLCLIPSAMISMSSDSFEESCIKLAEMYKEDLPSPECFTTEIETWKVKWQEHSTNYGNASLPDSPRGTLPQTSEMYPNIKVLLTILATLPVTTCSAERSFSSLTLLHVFRDIEVDLPSAIDEFARRHPRRLHMSDVLSD